MKELCWKDVSSSELNLKIKSSLPPQKKLVCVHACVHILYKYLFEGNGTISCFQAWENKTHLKAIFWMGVENMKYCLETVAVKTWRWRGGYALGLVLEKQQQIHQWALFWVAWWLGKYMTREEMEETGEPEVWTHSERIKLYSIPVVYEGAFETEGAAGFVSFQREDNFKKCIKIFKITLRSDPLQLSKFCPLFVWVPPFKL